MLKGRATHCLSLKVGASLALLFGSLLAFPVTGNAAQHPPLVPTRDVAVIYEVMGVKGPADAEQITLSYTDHGERVRMDFASKLTNRPIGAIIYDRPNDRILTLVPAKHVYYSVPASGRANPGLLLSDQMQYEKTGTATIAGLSCTEWKVSNGSGFTGSACVTADGVALEAKRSEPHLGTIEALKVTYGALPASLFQVPSGYKEVLPH